MTGPHRRAPRPLLWAVACVVATLLLAARGALAASYAPGSVVPTSWRGQFQRVRTVAQPLLHRHCPVFGVDKMVAIPLPKPNEVELGIEDDYKLQLLVDHEVFPTSWIRVLGKRNAGEGIPLVIVTIDYVGQEVTRVRATLTELPDRHHKEHREIIEEYLMRPAAAACNQSTEAVAFGWRKPTRFPTGSVSSCNLRTRRSGRSTRSCRTSGATWRGWTWRRGWAWRCFWASSRPGRRGGGRLRGTWMISKSFWTSLRGAGRRGCRGRRVRRGRWMRGRLHRAWAAG